MAGYNERATSASGDFLLPTSGQKSKQPEMLFLSLGRQYAAAALMPVISPCLQRIILLVRYSHYSSSRYSPTIRSF